MSTDDTAPTKTLTVSVNRHGDTVGFDIGVWVDGQLQFMTGPWPEQFARVRARDAVALAREAAINHLRNE